MTRSINYRKLLFKENIYLTSFGFKFSNAQTLPHRVECRVDNHSATATHLVLHAGMGDDLKSLDLETKRERKMTTVGKVLLGATGGVVMAICAVTVPFVSPALRKVGK